MDCNFRNSLDKIISTEIRKIETGSRFKSSQTFFAGVTIGKPPKVSHQTKEEIPIKKLRYNIKETIIFIYNGVSYLNSSYIE